MSSAEEIRNDALSKAVQAAIEAAKAARAPEEVDAALEQIEALCSEVEIIEVEPSLCAEFWARLGDCRFLTGQRTESIDMINGALDAYRLAIANEPDPHRCAKYRLNQAAALRRKSFLLGDDVLARQGYDMALEASGQIDHSTAPQDWASAQNTVGGLEITMGQRSGDISLLERAANRYEDLYTFCQTHTLVLLGVQAAINAGMAYKILAQLQSDPERFKSAFDAYGRAFAAVDAAPEGTVDIANRISLVAAAAGAHCAYGELQSDRDALWRAVALSAQAQALCRSMGDQIREARQQMLKGQALQFLGELGKNVATLRQGICAYSNAIEAFEIIHTPIDLAMAHMNRGNALRSLSQTGTEAEAFDGARADYEVALKIYAAADAPLSVGKTLANFGVAATMEGRRRWDGDLLVEALDLLARSAGRFNHHSTPLLWAGVKVFRAQALLALGDLEQDPSYWREAAAEVAQTDAVFSADTEPSTWANAQMDISRISARLGHWEEVRRRLPALLDHVVEAVAAAPSRIAQQQVVERARGTADLLAYALIEGGDLEGALRALVRGRATLLAAQNAMFRTAGDGEDAVRLRVARANWLDAAQRVERAERRLAVETASATERREELAVARNAFEKALATFRTASAVLTAAPMIGEAAAENSSFTYLAPTGAVIAIPIVTDVGGKILLLSRDVVLTSVPAPALTTSSLATLLEGDRAEEPTRDPALASLTGWQPGYRRFKEAGLFPSNRALRAWDAVIGETLDVLWLMVMGPLDRALAAMKPAAERVILIPPGRLAVLPIAAARRRIESGAYRSFVEKWPIELAPTLASRFAKEEFWTEPSPTVISQNESLLAVTPIARDAAENPAWECFEERCRDELTGEAATIQAVLDRLSSAGCLSLFCHGVWEPEDPDASGLELADGRLTIEHLRSVDVSSCRLVMLLACETGLIDTRLAPDEFTGLPASWLASGAPYVAATLWPVDKRVSATLAKRFFEERTDGADPALAMRAAQLLIAQRIGQDDQLLMPGSSQSQWPVRSGYADMETPGPALMGFGSSVAPDDQDAPPLPTDAPFFWAGFTLYAST